MALKVIHGALARRGCAIAAATWASGRSSALAASLPKLSLDNRASEQCATAPKIYFDKENDPPPGGKKSNWVPGGIPGSKYASLASAFERPADIERRIGRTCNQCF
jgi:hypothetical protein